jgi:serine/threonine-protein kinase RsbW
MSRVPSTSLDTFATALPFFIESLLTVNHLASQRVLACVLLSDLAMAPKRPSDLHDGGPCIQMELSLPSEAVAVSPFVDRLMLLIKKCRCAPGSETDVEIALREALNNAVIHGNREDPRKRVHVSCRCEAEQEVSLVVKDEGQGFDSNAVPDPTAPGAVESSHGRGIYLMKALMDEVRFEQGGAVVHMRKKSGNAQPDRPKKLR